MQKIIIVLLFTLGFLQAEEKTAKVIYDLTTKDLKTFERKILQGVVANKIHYNSQLKELEVTVVIHGGAYRFFTKDPGNSLFKNDTALMENYRILAKRIDSLIKTYDVEFLMCDAAMVKNKLQAKDVYSFVKIIPNSTIGLIDKQNEGYAYIPVN